MVLDDHGRIADDTRGLLVGLVPVVAEHAHGVQHPPVHGLEAIAHVGQRTPDDHAHCIVEIGLPHLLLETDRQHFAGELSH